MMNGQKTFSASAPHNLPPYHPLPAFNKFVRPIPPRDQPDILRTPDSSPSPEGNSFGNWLTVGLLFDLLVMGGLAFFSRVFHYTTLHLVIGEHLVLAAIGGLLALAGLRRSSSLLLALGLVPLVPVGLLTLSFLI